MGSPCGLKAGAVWDDQHWLLHLARPHLRHWIATVDGAPAALLSLDVQPDGEVELDMFGLLPSHLGRGIGGHFITVAVRLAWAVAPSVSRVWLHTSDRDHPHALRELRAARVPTLPPPGRPVPRAVSRPR